MLDIITFQNVSNYRFPSYSNIHQNKVKTLVGSLGETERGSAEAGWLDLYLSSIQYLHDFSLPGDASAEPACASVEPPGLVQIRRGTSAAAPGDASAEPAWVSAEPPCYCKSGGVL